MPSLDPLFAPIARVLNNGIRENTRARQSCERLAGSSVVIRVGDSALSACFSISEDALELSTDIPDDPDLVISGSAIALARLAGEDGINAIRGGSVQLIGDAAVASDFQLLLRHAKPDAEELLSGIVGDTFAHEIGRAATSVRRWARGARATMGDNVREYLQEEREEVPRRDEVVAFGKDIAVLRDDVERLLARADKLLRDQ